MTRLLGRIVGLGKSSFHSARAGQVKRTRFYLRPRRCTSRTMRRLLTSWRLTRKWLLRRLLTSGELTRWWLLRRLLMSRGLTRWWWLLTKTRVVMLARRPRPWLKCSLLASS